MNEIIEPVMLSNIQLISPVIEKSSSSVPASTSRAATAAAVSTATGSAVTASTSFSAGTASSVLPHVYSSTIINGIVQQHLKPIAIDETPNKLLYKKIETIIEKMQEDDKTGVPIRTVKSFMSKIPSVFTGSDLIQWMLKRLDVEDTLEALHSAHLIASHGYMFPIDDHILTVKNDGTFFRFQTPYYWPSNNTEPENTDYAAYLCKRTMQNKARLELADYEAENLAKLQKLLSRKWEFIYMQAEAQIKVDKKRDKMERKILDSQERAFWDLHRPAPGCVNTIEVDIRKTMRTKRKDYPNIGFFNSRNKPPGSLSLNRIQQQPPSSLGVVSSTNGLLVPIMNRSAVASSASAAVNSSSQSTLNSLLSAQKICENEERIAIDNLNKEKEFLKRRLERRYVKSSKVSESYTNFYEQYNEFDPFITPPDPSNPWIADSTEFWDMEKSLKDIPQRRVRRWGFSIHELLKDPCGRELFRRYLEREYSIENLLFYEVCSELRYATNKDIATRVNDIYNQFLAPNANCPINIDSRIMAITKSKMENPDRHTYDEAREHIFNLMTRDSYNRFLRSDIYRDSLVSAKKKLSKKF